MNRLYPLKFTPIIKETIWGGKRLKTELNKVSFSDECGESWEISDVDEDISVVYNGFLAGNNLEEMIEVYMDDLVGGKVFDKFGTRFPLLIKFIDANDVLSIQVHPDDELAKKRHNSFGKTEMWYIINCDPDSELICGFNQIVNKEIYLHHLQNNSLNKILNFEKVQRGDVFFIPAGRVHAIGSGILLAEIQQTSDITYRIYDWNRTDANGNPRELHTNLALDAIDYKVYNNYKIKYEQVLNRTANIVDCPYFFTNTLKFNKPIEKDYSLIDSFVIYMCIEGKFYINPENGESLPVNKGETVLLPAILKNLTLQPEGQVQIIEVYIK
jgi:mannose-6-phosphate isomerase